MALFKLGKKKETGGCCCGRTCKTDTINEAETTKLQGISIKVLGSGCAK